MQVWPRICCCKFLSTSKYLEQLSYNLFCLVQGNYQIQQGVTPFILAWQVGKDLPGLNLEESRQMEWRDTLKSQAKTLGATHWGVAPHRGADQIWPRPIMCQVVTSKEMAWLYDESRFGRRRKPIMCQLITPRVMMRLLARQDTWLATTRLSISHYKIVDRTSQHIW